MSSFDDGWGAPRISTADDNGWRAAGADDGWGVPQQQAKPSVEWERPLPEEPWWSMTVAHDFVVVFTGHDFAETVISGICVPL